MRSCQINFKILTGNSSSPLLTTAMPATYNSMSRLSSQTLKMQSFVQLQLFFYRHIDHQGCVYHLIQESWRRIQQLGLVPLYNSEGDLRLFCGMMEDVAFLPVPDLTNGIHLLRTLCRDEPPEAAELLDYFDSTYISGRLRQQNPAQNQAVRLVLRRSLLMFPPDIWNVHDTTVNGDARANMCDGWNNKFFNLVGQPIRLYSV